MTDETDTTPDVYGIVNAQVHRLNAASDTTLGQVAPLTPGSPYWFNSPLIWTTGRIGPFGTE